jgi:hypothetical protein
MSHRTTLFATAGFSHNTTRSDCMAGFGLLTAARLRDIRLTLSWRPVSAANKHRAKLPENPANIALSGQKGLLINGSATYKTGQGRHVKWRAVT